MGSEGSATIRLYGCLHTLRRARGEPTVVTVALPPEGRRADDLARELGLPLDRIEAIFVNHVTYDLSRRVRPGDQAAFVPQGVPGPHRFTLGIYSAGRGEGRAAGSE